jgi:hypothetical protein
MKIPFPVYPVFMALPAIFAYCTSNTSIAGGSSEVGNPVIVGTLLGEEGIPCAHARVRLIPIDYNPVTDGALPDSLIDTTNTMGRYLFEHSDTSAVFNIQANDAVNAKIVMIRGVKSSIDTSYISATTLLPPETLSIAIPDHYDNYGDYVYIPGTSVYSQGIGHDGYLLLKGVPTGYPDSIVLASASNLFTPKVLQTPALLLDNFDDGDARSEIFGLVPLGIWFAYADSVGAGRTKVEPVGLCSNFLLGLTQNGGYRGTSFHATFTLGTEPIAQFSGLGLEFKEKADTSFFDFSKLESISLAVKGRGSIRVNIWTERATKPYPKEMEWGQLGTVIQCPSEWQRITVYPADFTTPEGTSQRADRLTWNDGKKRVDHVEIRTWGQPGNTVEFWVDEIVMTGIAKDVFRR